MKKKVEKDPGRVAIVEKIAEFERLGKWSVDVEEDPPTIPLEPDQVDYLNKKLMIYPEQAMWWNYRKPRPMVNGAYRFAAECNTPILPMFITMNDSELIGSDGFPIQEYTLHILPAIYPDENKTKKENAEDMKNKNYEAWKKVYEDFYGIPLTYTTETAAN